MKKVIFAISMSLFIVCSQNPRDQCEEHRMRNGTAYTADDCAIQFLIMNSFSLNPNLDSQKTPEQRESARVSREQFNLWVGNICLQSSIASEKCRKTKPGFSNR